MEGVTLLQCYTYTVKESGCGGGGGGRTPGTLNPHTKIKAFNNNKIGGGETQILQSCFSAFFISFFGEILRNNIVYFSTPKNTFLVIFTLHCVHVSDVLLFLTFAAHLHIPVTVSCTRYTLASI